MHSYCTSLSSVGSLDKAQSVIIMQSCLQASSGKETHTSEACHVVCACSGKDMHTNEACHVVCAVEGGAGPGCRQLLHLEAF